VKIAHERFSFLRDSRAHVEIVLGDARLALWLGSPNALLVLRLRDPNSLLDARALRTFNPGALLNLRAFGALPHLRTLGSLDALLRTLLRALRALLRALSAGPLRLGRRCAFGLRGPLASLAATFGLGWCGNCQSGNRGDQKYLVHG